MLLGKFYSRLFLIILLMVLGIQTMYAQFQTNGSASDIGGDCYRLTTTATWEVGSLFSSNTIDLTQPFNQDIAFDFGDMDGGADGITFLFSTSNTALGTGGGGMGYEGISPSFVVEFDTWQNAPGANNDPASDHAGIQQNGNPIHGSADELVAPIPFPNLEDGNQHCGAISWNPTTMEFSITLDGMQISYIGDIAAIMGTNNVFWGFTASTGGATNEQIVCFPDPNPMIVPMNDITICNGETAQLQADPNGGGFSWTFDPSLTATDISNPMATPNSTTTYFVDVDFGCGNILSDDVTVTVSPGPVASAASNSPVCFGGTIQLTATGGTSYVWSGPNGFNNASQSATINNVNFNHAGLYSVTVTDGDGCTNVDDVTVTVLTETPAIIIPPASPICEGGMPVQLTANPPGGVFGGAASSNGTINPAFFTPGLYLVTYNGLDANGCPSNGDIMIEIVANPNASASFSGNLCEGEDITLMGSGGDSYLWTGPNGFNSMEQNPELTDVSAANSGTYFLTVYDNAGCSGMNALNITINPPPSVSINPPPPLCQTNGQFQMTANPSGGIWGGAADPSGIVDPNAFPGNSTQSVTYTYTDNNGCIGTDDVLIAIAADPMVTIDPAGPFCDTDPTQSLTANPPDGTWGGVANANGEIDPQDLGEGTYDVTYSYTDPNGCMGMTTESVQILAGTNAEIISSDPFCQSAGIQILDGIPTGGAWGGVANTNGEIDPSTLIPGLHEVTYSVTPPGGCLSEVSIMIEILANPSATISGNETICAGSNNTVDISIDAFGAAPIQIIYSIDADPQPEINVSNGNNSIPVSEAGIYTIVSVIDANGCGGMGNGMAEVTVVDAPQVISFAEVCDLAQENYMVNFDIIGGDQNSYQVEGMPTGTLTNSSFESQPIPTGGSYNIIVFDSNHCDTIELVGSFNCECLTESGTMDLTPINLCEDEMATSSANGDEFLDTNDALIFVLHDGNGNSLGNIFQTNTSPEFFFMTPMETGTTYYISAVAADDLGGGAVDYDDGCLSVSFGTPVQWQELPDGVILEDAAICDGEETTLIFNLTGNGPFDVVYSFDGQNATLENILDGHTIAVSPSTTTTYELIEIFDSSSPTCHNTANSTATITVNDHFGITQTTEICEGDSILLGGEMQTMEGLYIDSLETINGCDSIIFTNLIVHEIDTTYLTDTDCNMNNVGTFVDILLNENNCDSVVILTVTFSQVDTVFEFKTTCEPDSVGEFTSTYIDPNGCEVTLIETFAQLPIDTTELFETSCYPDSVGVFETILMNEFGCDSTIIRTVELTEMDTVFEFHTTCLPDSVGIYTSTFFDPDGCEITLIENYSQLPVDTTELFETSCYPDSVGVFETILMNEFGCDSTIILTVSFIEMDTINNTEMTCNPDSVGVYESIIVDQEGCETLLIETFEQLPIDTTELFDVSCNPMEVGVFESILPNQFGCDSTIILTVDFEAIDTTFLSNTTCDPTAAGVFNNTIQTIEGCDSTISLMVTFVPIDTTFLEDSTCDPMVAGTFVNTIQTADGCDSTIVETILLNPSDSTEIFETSCDLNDVGVFQNVLPNQYGCDSTIILTVSFIESDTTIIPLTTCEPLDTGTVIMVFMNQNGCDSTVISTTTLLPPNQCGVAGNLTASLIGCDESTGFLTLEISTGEAPFNYNWTGPNAGMDVLNNLNELVEITNLVAGNYSVEITDTNGNSIILTAEINQIFPPTVSIEILDEISCFSEMDGQIIAIGTGGQAPYTFEWSTNETETAIDNLFPDTYVVTITDVNECTAEASISLIEPEELTMEFTISNIDCFGADEGSVEVGISGGQEPYQYSINGGEFGDNSIFFGLTEGAYQIVGQDGNGCTITEGFAINAPIPLEVDLGDDIFIDLGDSDTLDAIINYPLNEIDTIHWGGIDSLECPTCPTQQIAPIVTSTYSITVVADNGCSDEDDLTVFVNRQKEIFMPNIFSPNGDKINDEFYIMTAEHTVREVKDFLVFSRWGHAVYKNHFFQPNDPASGWDGTYRGKVMNPDVYTWYAEVEFEDGKLVKFKGDVILIK